MKKTLTATVLLGLAFAMPVHAGCPINDATGEPDCGNTMTYAPSLEQGIVNDGSGEEYSASQPSEIDGYHLDQHALEIGIDPQAPSELPGGRMQTDQ